MQWNAKYDTEVQQLEENREKTREKIVEIKLKSDELHELYIIRQVLKFIFIDTIIYLYNDKYYYY